jgi:hypothetical protein
MSLAKSDLGKLQGFQRRPSQYIDQETRYKGYRILQQDAHLDYRLLVVCLLRD